MKNFYRTFIVYFLLSLFSVSTISSLRVYELSKISLNKTSNDAINIVYHPMYSIYFAAVTSQSTQIWMYNFKQNMFKLLFEKEWETKISSFSWHPKKPMLSLAFDDGSISFFAYQNKKITPVFSLKETDHEVAPSLAWHPNGSTFVSYDTNNLINIWSYDDLRNKAILKKSLSSKNPNKAALFLSPTGNLCLSEKNGTLRIASFKDEEPVFKKFPALSTKTSFLDYHPSLHYVSSCDTKGRINLWSYDYHLNSCDHLQSLKKTHKGSITGIKWHTIYPVFASCDDKGLIKIWSRDESDADFSEQQTIKDSAPVSSISWHPMLPMLLSCNKNGTIKAWHLPDLTPQETLKKLDQSVTPTTKKA